MAALAVLIAVVGMMGAYWAGRRSVPVPEPVPTPPPLDAVEARARALCGEVEGIDVSGEYKRHVVYARLLKEFPEHSRRAVSLAIERGLPVLLLVLLSATANAQTVTNPSTVTFTVSADHAQVTKYTIAYFAAGATAPVQGEMDLGTGTPAADNTLTFAINAKPLALGASYTAKVRAWAGAVSSEWSDPSNPFDRVPVRTGKPVIK